jgi:TolA-binding protein
MRALRRVQQQFPGTDQAGEAQYWLGMTLFRNEQFAEARQIFQNLANTMPTHPRAATALLRIADAFYNEKRFQDGLIAYRKVSLLHPQTAVVADARYGTVLSYYQLQQYPQFLREAQTFTQEYRQHPLSGSLLLQVAAYYQEQQRLDDAINTYSTLVQRYPQSVFADKALFRLGELYATTGKPQQALTTYERLLQEGKTEELKPDALLGQGRAYEALGDTSAAVQCYEQVATQYPKSALAPRGLLSAARLMSAQNNAQAAQRYLTTLTEQYPEDPLRYEGLLEWGTTLLRLKQPDRAISTLQQVLKAPEPGVAAQAQLQLGYAYAQAGDLQQSINAHLRVAYLYPDEAPLVLQALRQAAQNYVKLGRCTDASTVYAKLLERSPNTQEAQNIRREIERSGCSSATTRPPR